MSAGHAQTLVGACEDAQHLCALLYFESIVAEPCELLVGSRDGRCVDHETGSLVAAGMRNLIDVFLIVNNHSLLFQLLCEGRRRLVVSCHYHTAMDEVAGDGAHADAACTNKINSFNVFEFHYIYNAFSFSTLYHCACHWLWQVLCHDLRSPALPWRFLPRYALPGYALSASTYLLASLMTSSAMTSAEFFSPSFRMFSFSEASFVSSATVASALSSRVSAASASLT